MLRKTTALLGLSVLVAGLLFPLVSLAATYKACYENQINDKGKCEDASGSDLRRTVCYDGIVPCGKKVWVEGAWDDDNQRCNPATPGAKLTTVSCQFCHLRIMIDGIIDYVLLMIVPL